MGFTYPNPNTQPKDQTMDTTVTLTANQEVDIALIGTPVLEGPAISEYSTDALTFYSDKLDARIRDLRLSAMTLEARALMRINSELARREQARLAEVLQDSFAQVGRTAVRMFECDPIFWAARFPLELVEAIQSHLDGVAARGQ